MLSQINGKRPQISVSEEYGMIFTEEVIVDFRKDFNAAMDALREKYNATISLGSISYDETSFSARLSVYSGRDKEDVAIAKFDANVWKFADLGLKPGMYKRIFIGRDGERYALLGLNARASKNQMIILHLETGQRYSAGRGFLKELTDSYYAEIIDKG